MSRIFGFDYRLDIYQNWHFNINHLFLFLFLIASMIILWFSLFSKTNKGIKITKLSLVVVMFVLEVARIIYIAAYLNHKYGEINWWVAISFSLCAIFVWITIATLIASIYVNKDNQTLNVFKNTLFGGAAIGGVAVFVNPTNIYTHLPVFHFINAQSIIQHILLAFVPFYLIKIGELKIEFKNLWMPLIGFLGVFTLAITASQISGVNFFNVIYDYVVSGLLGWYLVHPYPILVAFVGIFLINLVIYGAVEIFRRYILKGEVEVKNKNNFEKIIVLPYLAVILVIILNLYMPSWLGADFSAPDELYQYRAIRSWLALVLIIPFSLQVLLMFWIKKYRKK